MNAGLSKRGAYTKAARAVKIHGSTQKAGRVVCKERGKRVREKEKRLSGLRSSAEPEQYIQSHPSVSIFIEGGQEPGP